MLHTAEFALRGPLNTDMQEDERHLTAAHLVRWFFRSGEGGPGRHTPAMCYPPYGRGDGACRAMLPASVAQPGYSLADRLGPYHRCAETMKAQGHSVLQCNPDEVKR
jgi:hypothetical protein